MSKKTIIGVVVYFVIVIAIMLLLIPVENKNIRYKKWGSLAELAETDSRAEFIIENEELYTDDIIDLFYENNDRLELVYNYAFYKDAYDTMSFTEAELNSGEVPKLYMKDPRWAYEYLDKETLAECGCSCVAIAATYLYLYNDGTVDPVVVANVVNALDAISFPEGILIIKTADVIEALNMNVESVDCGIEIEPVAVERDRLIEIIDDKDSVLLVAVSSDEFGNHMLVLRDYCDEGYYINDPASPEKSEKIWPFEEIEKDIVYYWRVTRK